MVNQISMGRGAGRRFNTSKIPGGGCGKADSGVVRTILRGKQRGGISKSARLAAKNETHINAVPSEYVATIPTKLLVSNLDIRVSCFDIQELFSEFGTIMGIKLNDDTTQRSTRTAEITFERHADALKAYDEYNGRTLDERPMEISFENPNIQTEETNDENECGGGEPAGEDISIVDVCKLHILNLDNKVTDSDIKELFSEFNSFISAAVNYDETGRSLGTAEVVYQMKAEALKAYDEYHGRTLDGRTMFIEISEMTNFDLGKSRGYNGGGFDLHKLYTVIASGEK
ncbi:THO complex subunit 4-like [Spodoptera frugiperda]|uniref:THO complex subunit 4-like n=1 Tax=Spodoptera frugiperda TaxID=7108 RepID=A0A9R0D232_SPOFR|nr:THO complex subunit 4-like [Spodoptera frugiperda]